MAIHIGILLRQGSPPMRSPVVGPINAANATRFLVFGIGELADFPIRDIKLIPAVILNSTGE